MDPSLEPVPLPMIQSATQMLNATRSLGPLFNTGIVALSLALAPPARARGRYWEIPLDAYPRMEQGGMILKDSQAARDFRAFLLSAAGRRILKQYGFFVPGE